MSNEAADIAAALEVNAAFYAAFRASDLAGMDDLWARQEPVCCVHPGGVPIAERVAVIASWQNLFESGAPDIHESDCRGVLVRGLAFVSCLEHIGAGSLTATNIFVWEAGRWRLVLHHAGPMADSITASSEAGSSGVLH